MIEGYTKIDQKDEFHKEQINEYTNIKGLTIKEAFKGKDQAGYDLMEIRFTNGLILNILEQGQTGKFTAWVEG